MRCLQRAVIMAVVALAVAASAAAQDNGNNGWGGRGFATFNVGAQTGSPAFDYNYVTTLFDQTATAGLKTPGKTGLTFDAGAGVRLVQNLGVGVTFSRYSNQRNATLTTTVPSPLNAYFPSEASTVSKELPLQREESAVHIQAIYRVPLGARVQVGAFGGPSYFRCVDDHITKFSLQGDLSQLGAWSVSYADVQQMIDRGSAWGYHGGGSVTVLASRHVGVGMTVRYSTASHMTTNHLSDTSQLNNSGVWGGDTSTVSVKMKHGGIQWNGGVSFHF
jgi:hypothetical protein